VPRRVAHGPDERERELRQLAARCQPRGVDPSHARIEHRSLEIRPALEPRVIRRTGRLSTDNVGRAVKRRIKESDLRWLIQRPGRDQTPGVQGPASFSGSPREIGGPIEWSVPSS